MGDQRHRPAPPADVGQDALVAQALGDLAPTVLLAQRADLGAEVGRHRPHLVGHHHQPRHPLVEGPDQADGEAQDGIAGIDDLGDEDEVDRRGVDRRGQRSGSVGPVRVSTAAGPAVPARPRPPAGRCPPRTPPPAAVARPGRGPSHPWPGPSRGRPAPRPGRRPARGRPPPGPAGRSRSRPAPACRRRRTPPPGVPGPWPRARCGAGPRSGTAGRGRRRRSRTAASSAWGIGSTRRAEAMPARRQPVLHLVLTAARPHQQELGVGHPGDHRRPGVEEHVDRLVPLQHADEGDHRPFRRVDRRRVEEHVELAVGDVAVDGPGVARVPGQILQGHAHRPHPLRPPQGPGGGGVGGTGDHPPPPAPVHAGRGAPVAVQLDLQPRP